MMTKPDYLYFALIVLGLSLGLAYVFIGYGWDKAILFCAVVCFAAGMIGGLRK